MDQAFDIISNPWVSGIIVGVISSLIVFFISQFFLNRKAKKEYFQKLETANNELLYSLKSLLIEKNKKFDTVYDAVKNSVARKYNLDVSLLNSIILIKEDLVKEIVSNSILTNEQKKEFCEILLFNEEDNKRELLDDELIDLSKKTEKQYKQSNINYSYILSVLAAVITFIGTLLSGLDDKGSSNINFITQPIYFIAVLLLVIAVAIVVVPLINKLLTPFFRRVSNSLISLFEEDID